VNIAAVYSIFYLTHTLTTHTLPILTHNTHSQHTLPTHTHHMYNTHSHSLHIPQIKVTEQP